MSILCRRLIKHASEESQVKIDTVRNQKWNQSVFFFDIPQTSLSKSPPAESSVPDIGQYLYDRTFDCCLTSALLFNKINSASLISYYSSTYQQITLRVCCRWRLKLSRVTKERFYKRGTVQSHIEDSGSALLHEYKCEWVSGLFICQWVRTHWSVCPSIFQVLVQQYFDWNTFIRDE